MGCDVYANLNAIACKAGDGKAIASFPDVCLSPPSPPAGPIPIPYPNTSFDKDMQNGSKTVMIKAQEVMLKDQSFFKTSPLGDEAATNSFGGSVVTHVITGKTYFAAWSMDVQFEGQNVDRNLDLTGSNHASPPPSPPPVNPKISEVTTPPVEKLCPCPDADGNQHPCHPNQVDPDTGEMYKPISEKDFYQEGQDFRRNELSPERVAEWSADPNIPDHIKAVIPDNDKKYLEKSEAASKTLEDARKKGNCPNLHKEGDPCGQYLNKTNPEPKTATAKDRRKLGFNDAVRDACLARHPNKPDGTPIPAKDPITKEGPSIAHMTPLSAGGCPISQKNLIPKEALTDECKAVDDAQSTLQVDKAAARKAAIDRAKK